MDPGSAISLFLLALAGLVGFGTFVNAISGGRNTAYEKARDERFDEAMRLQNAATDEAEHLRERIEDVRKERDELKSQLAEEKAKVERRDIRIAQLEDRIDTLDTRERAMRKLLKAQGVEDIDGPA